MTTEEMIALVQKPKGILHGFTDDQIAAMRRNIQAWKKLEKENGGAWNKQTCLTAWQSANASTAPFNQVTADQMDHLWETTT